MILTKEKAVSILDSGHRQNPGLWKKHSLVAAKIASTIARQIEGIDPEQVEIYAMLHDIGRKDSPRGLRHSIDGYLYLRDLGAAECARYCITHSFPGKKFIEHYDFMIAQDDKNFFLKYLEDCDFTLTDKIIQISDLMATPYGPTIMEVRFLEACMRNGTNILAFEYWKECQKVKNEIDSVLKYSVYQLFDDLLVEWPSAEIQDSFGLNRTIMATL